METPEERILKERILGILVDGPMTFDKILAKVKVSPGEFGGAMQKLQGAHKITTVSTLGGGWKLVPMINVTVSLWEKKTRLEEEVSNLAVNMGGKDLSCSHAGKGGTPLTIVDVDFPTIRKALKFIKIMFEKDLQVEAGPN